VFFGGEARERCEELDLLKKALTAKGFCEAWRRTPKLLELGAETRNMTFLVCRIRGFARDRRIIRKRPGGPKPIGAPAP